MKVGDRVKITKDDVYFNLHKAGDEGTVVDYHWSYGIISMFSVVVDNDGTEESWCYSSDELEVIE